MPDDPPGAADRLAGLRAHAAQRRQATVERLRAAIAALEAAGRPVSAATIKEVSGLDYMAYYRNAEACTLYRRHSTHLQADRTRARAQHLRRREPPPGDATPAAPADDRLARPKAGLVADLRAAQADRDAWRQRYHDLVQHQLQLAETIAHLEAKLADYTTFLERVRRRREDEEQGADHGSRP